MGQWLRSLWRQFQGHLLLAFLALTDFQKVWTHLVSVTTWNPTMLTQAKASKAWRQSFAANGSHIQRLRWCKVSKSSHQWSQLRKQVPVPYGKNRLDLAPHKVWHKFNLVLFVRMGKYSCFAGTTRTNCCPITHKMQNTSIRQGFY